LHCWLHNLKATINIHIKQYRQAHPCCLCILSTLSLTAFTPSAVDLFLPPGPALLHSSIFSNPSTLRQVSAALLATFQLDPSSAALLLRAAAGFAGGEVTAAAAAAAAAAGGDADPASPAAAATASLKMAAGHPLLPRMPLSLQYLTSAESYKAAAGLARALGRAARLADAQQQAAGIAGKDRTGVPELLVCVLLGGSAWCEL
jgi:hypothetical protein